MPVVSFRRKKRDLFIRFSKKWYIGSPTSTWSLKLILGGFVVLASTTKPPNMNAQLYLEVGEPAHRYFHSSRELKDTTGTGPLKGYVQVQSNSWDDIFKKVIWGDMRNRLRICFWNFWKYNFSFDFFFQRKFFHPKYFSTMTSLDEKKSREKFSLKKNLQKSSKHHSHQLWKKSS